MYLSQAIKDSRIARWATIGIVINVLALPGAVFNQLKSSKTVKLVIPAADVTPLHNTDTGKLESYYVKAIPVDEVAIWARWPTFTGLYGAIGINLLLLVWILRLAIRQNKFLVGETEIRELRLPSRSRTEEQESPNTGQSQSPASPDHAARDD